MIQQFVRRFTSKIILFLKMLKISFLLIGIALASTHFSPLNLETSPADGSGGLKSDCTDDISKAAEYLTSAGIKVAKAILDCAFTPSKCAQDIGNIGSDLANSSKEIEAALKDCDNISSKCANDISAIVGSLS